MLDDGCIMYPCDYKLKGKGRQNVYHFLVFNVVKPPCGRASHPYKKTYKYNLQIHTPLTKAQAGGLPL